MEFGEISYIPVTGRDPLLSRLFPDATIAECITTAVRKAEADKVLCTLKVRFATAPESYPPEVLVHHGRQALADTRHEASDIAVMARLQQLASSRDTTGVVPEVLKVGRVDFGHGSRLDYFCEEYVTGTVSLDSVLGEISESNLGSIADVVLESTCLREIHQLRIDSEEALSSLRGTPLNPVYDDGKSYGGWIGGPHLGYHKDTASLLKRVFEPPQAASTHNPLIYSLMAPLDLDGNPHVVIDSTRYPDLKPIQLTTKDLKHLYSASVLCHFALQDPSNILVWRHSRGQFSLAAIANWRHAAIMPLPLEAGLVNGDRGASARSADCAWSRVLREKALALLKPTDPEQKLNPEQKLDPEQKLLRGLMLVQQAISREERAGQDISMGEVTDGVGTMQVDG
ncbi:hypothetical protein Daus18300_009932 [Diaporthe australafricana]|uniref:Uncharacterized protein n=1 Tax=Diaporthe australafricana TaxID=127596 RepID=A0ABR3WCD7_9PEZI